MTKTEYMTAVKPPYKARSAAYLMTVITIPKVRFSITKTTSPSLGPCLHSHLVTNGMIITNNVWMRTEYVHMKKQFCAHFCGLPCLGSICKARILAPTNRIHNIGAKLTVYFASVRRPSNLVKNGEDPES